MELGRELFHVLSFPFGPSPGCCDGCGAFLRVDHSLCRRCVAELDRTFGEPLVFPHPLDPTIRCRALWDWWPGESDALSAAILGLKGRGRRKTWEALAACFLRCHADSLFRREGQPAGHLEGRAPIPMAAEQPPGVNGGSSGLEGARVRRLVALPNANPRRRHAEDFALGLSEILGGELATLEGQPVLPTRPPGLLASVLGFMASLDRSPSPSTAVRPQKRKTRRARLADLKAASEGAEGDTPELLAEGFSTLPAAQPTQWILVDDVLTTGVTSLLALRSLREKTQTPGNSYEIWTLARRSRLAP